MVKSLLFDIQQVLESCPEIPHYGNELTCFWSDFRSRIYPKNRQYFNREFALVFILSGTSEILLNGEYLKLEANTLLIHGANYLTSHLVSSPDIKSITLYLSKQMITADLYLDQTLSVLLAALHKNRQYQIQLEKEEADVLLGELEDLMKLLKSGHRFLMRRILALCTMLFLDITHFYLCKDIVTRELTRKEHLMQEFHALVTGHYKEEHFVDFYADKLLVSKQYLTRIVKEATGKTVNGIIGELLTMEACTLLARRELQVGEVALQLHFSDAASFCKFFKRNMGCAPLEYRKKLWTMG